MKFRDYFKDPRKGVLKDEFEFGAEKRQEFLQALREQPRSGKPFRPGEFAAFVKERKERLERLRKRRDERNSNNTAPSV